MPEKIYEVYNHIINVNVIYDIVVLEIVFTDLCKITIYLLRRVAEDRFRNTILFKRRYLAYTTIL